MKRKAPVVLCSGKIVQDDFTFVAGEPPRSIDAKCDSATDVGAFQTFAGGAAANAAIAAGTLTRTGYGIDKVRLYSAFGHASAAFHEDLEASGIQQRNCADVDFEIPVNKITVFPNGSRLVVRDNRELPGRINYSELRLPEKLNVQLEEDLEFADTVLLGTSGHLLSLDIAKEAREAEVPVVLDAGAWQDYMPDLLGVSDVAIASHEFQPNGEKATPQEIIAYMQETGVHHVAVTHGENSLLAKSGAEDHFEVPITSFGQTVDTLGAGDIMHGAFAFYYSKEQDFRASLYQACAIASMSVTQRGPRAALHALTKDQIRNPVEIPTLA